MKKSYTLLLALALLLTALSAMAEESGMWEEREYVDEFELPTGETYVSNKNPIVGKFSNSATTDSLLEVYLFYDEGIISFRLIEYGSYIVKNSFSGAEEYKVSLMDPKGERYYLTASMASKSDTLRFDAEDSKTIVNALCQDGLVRFSIQGDTSKYLFNITDSSGFSSMLLAYHHDLDEQHYQEALRYEQLHDYDNAVQLFASLKERNYLDSAQRYDSCLLRVKYKDAQWNAFLGYYDSAIKGFKELGDYMDSAQQVVSCQRAQTLKTFAFQGELDKLAMTQCLSKYIEEYDIITAEELPEYMLGWWVFHYPGERLGMHYVCQATRDQVYEIGRVLEDGSYRLTNRNYLLHTPHDRFFSVDEQNVVTMGDEKYQFRRITDFLFAAYTKSEKGYTEPAFLANRVVATNVAYYQVYNDAYAHRARYAAPQMAPLTFAFKDGDTVEDWFASDASAVTIAAALLTERGDYQEFMTYGDLQNTYMTIYNGTNIMLFGMKDYMIMYQYNPTENTLICQYNENRDFTESYATQLIRSWGCNDYKKIPAEVWRNYFASSGHTEQSVMQHWTEE